MKLPPLLHVAGKLLLLAFVAGGGTFRLYSAGPSESTPIPLADTPKRVRPPILWFQEPSYPFFLGHQAEDASVERLTGLGPLLEESWQPAEAYSTLRPLWIDIRQPEKREQHVLYPFYNRFVHPGLRSWNIFSLIERTQGHDGFRSAHAFPFYFFQETGHPDSSYRGIMPLGGKVRNLFGMDQIEWFAFPLWVKITRNQTVRHHTPWPFIQHMHGNARGAALWPLIGSFEQKDCWRYRYLLWPIAWESWRKKPRGGESRIAAVLPFYYKRQTPTAVSRDYLWPFIGYTRKWSPEDLGPHPGRHQCAECKGYRGKALPLKATTGPGGLRKAGKRGGCKSQANLAFAGAARVYAPGAPEWLFWGPQGRGPGSWAPGEITPVSIPHCDRRCTYYEVHFPWPLVVKIRGDRVYEDRFLPFYSWRQDDLECKRWLLWPGFKVRRWEEGAVVRRRHQVFYFFISSEQQHETRSGRYLGEKTHLWPLLSYWNQAGVAQQFQLLSPLEPFFPHNEVIRRLYSPLFALYRYENRPQEGFRRHALLWNLVVWERQKGGRSQHRLGPLWSYKRQAGHTEVAILKGLVRYEKSAQGRPHLRFFSSSKKKTPRRPAKH